MTDLRASQVEAEVVVAGDAILRASQAAAEVVVAGPSDLRVSQVVVEVVVGATLELHAHQVLAEVVIEATYPIEVSLTPATTTDTAQALSYEVEEDIEVTLAPATTLDQAQALSYSVDTSIEVTLEPATTVDEAQPLSYSVAAPPTPSTPPIVVRPNTYVFGFDLARSTDLRKIADLTSATGRSLTITLNRAGAFQTSLPLADPTSTLVDEVKTCVIVRRRGEYVWSGPVWTVAENTPNGLSVGCVGWLQTLEKRVTKPDWGPGPSLQYAAMDAGVIAQALLARSNDDADYPDTNYVQPGAVEATQPRTKTYQAWTPVLDAITELSNIEAGYDMLVHPRTRHLDIFARIGVIRPNVLFEYGATASAMSRTCDASKICNRFIAYSAIGWAQADDLVSQANFGLFEEAVSLSDVRDIGILQAFANAEIAVRSRPLRFHGFEPRQFSSEYPTDARIFQDFNVGDTVYIKGHRGRMQINKQAVRIFSATILFDDNNGRETLTSLQTTVTS